MGKGLRMPILTDDEYNEYLLLKEKAKRLGVLDSLSHTTRLEDDIDEPIKRCVAALALLGCEPIWSCCGFDYLRQPLHKYHQYGRVFFVLRRNDHSDTFVEACPNWQHPACIEGGEECIDFHIDVKNVIPQWDNTDCIHYYEPFVGHIQALEDFLYRFSDLFAEEVTLHDTNNLFKERFRLWQYPVMADWVIRKSDYVAEKEKL